jgi:hypothetical protein
MVQGIITIGTKYPKDVIPAQAVIYSRIDGVCKAIPASAGMTSVCLFNVRRIKNRRYPFPALHIDTRHSIT